MIRGSRANCFSMSCTLRSRSSRCVSGSVGGTQRTEHELEELPLGQRPLGLEQGMVALASSLDRLPRRADDARDQGNEYRGGCTDAEPMTPHELADAIAARIGARRHRLVLQ